MVAVEHGTVHSCSQPGLQVLKWSLGGCVPLTGSQLSALRFFWPWQQSGKHVPHCNERMEAFSKNCPGKNRLGKRAQMQSSTKRGREVACF